MARGARTRRRGIGTRAICIRARPKRWSGWPSPRSAACGCSPALFDDSDGTAKREALRQFHLGMVQPLARVLETELSAKFEAPVRLRFDLYAVDLAGRAQAFQKLVAGGMAPAAALVASGLLTD